MKTINFTVPSGRDNHILHGRIWSCDAPKAVIALVHGLGEHCGRYLPMGRALSEHGIAISALDLHGHGRTLGKRGVADNVEVLLADIDALLKKTRESFPDVPVILMGHSMGGGLVLKYALDNPVLHLKAIIAQAPLIEPAKPLPAPLVSILKLVSKISPKIAIQSRFKGSDISSLPEEAKLYMEDPLNHGYLGLALGVSLFAAGDEIAARGAEISYPVLLTHGTNDVLTSYEASSKLAQDLPNVSFKTYDGSAHEIHNEFCRDQVYTDITAFVSANI